MDNKKILDKQKKKVQDTKEQRANRKKQKEIDKAKKILEHHGVKLNEQPES